MSWQDFACKLWTGYIGTHGYGLNGRKEYVHRLAWVEANGPIPPETPFVLHRCDVRHCYEAEHLFVGTQADNVADMIAKGRYVGWMALGIGERTHCPHGHVYDETNTYNRPDGARGCRACLVRATREWRARRRAQKVGQAS